MNKLKVPVIGRDNKQPLIYTHLSYTKMTVVFIMISLVHFANCQEISIKSPHMIPIPRSVGVKHVEESPIQNETNFKNENDQLDYFRYDYANEEQEDDPA